MCIQFNSDQNETDHPAPARGSEPQPPCLGRRHLLVIHRETPAHRLEAMAVQWVSAKTDEAKVTSNPSDMRWW